MIDMFNYHGISITSFILMLIRYPRLIYRSNKSGKKLMKTFNRYKPLYELAKYNNKMIGDIGRPTFKLGENRDYKSLFYLFNENSCWRLK